jgi:hypothetical protein
LDQKRLSVSDFDIGGWWKFYQGTMGNMQIGATTKPPADTIVSWMFCKVFSPVVSPCHLLVTRDGLNSGPNEDPRNPKVSARRVDW